MVLMKTEGITNSCEINGGPWRLALTWPEISLRILPLFCTLCLFFAGRGNLRAGTPNSTDATASSSTSAASSEGANFWTQDELTGDWGGYRKQLEDRGISFGLDWVVQGFKNFQGGISTGETGASTVDFNITLDTAKLMNWPDGKFYFDLQDHAGPDPSAYLVGDLEKFTKLNYSPFLQVAELWYEQKFFNDTFRLKIGKIDANTEFSVIDNGLNFLSSSTQVTPTLLVFPTFPDPMPGVNAFFTPNDLLYASFGMFYANRDDRFLDFTGSPQAAQFTQGGVFLIGETGLKWKHLLDWQADGNLRLGFWGDTGTFTRLDGGREQGTHGLYVIADQTLWKPTDKNDEARGIRTFLEYAQTPGDVSIMDRHVGGGVTWTGLLPGRDADVIGLSPQYVHLGDNAGLPKSYELTAEGFYRYQIAKWGSIQPDLQYIVNPGGRYSNALVLTVQLEFHF